MTGNEMYEETNLESYPDDVTERVLLAIEKVMPFIPAESYIADMGCGNKFVGETLSANEYFDFYPRPEDDVKLVDLDKFTIDMDGHSPIKTEDYARFDVISLFHVLEHVKFPTSAIRFLNLLLKRKGRLLITLPVGDYDNKHQPFNKDIGHISIWKQPEMFNIIDYGGFKVLMFELLEHKGVSKGYHEYIMVLEKL